MGKNQLWQSVLPAVRSKFAVSFLICLNCSSNFSKSLSICSFSCCLSNLCFFDFAITSNIISLWSRFAYRQKVMIVFNRKLALKRLPESSPPPPKSASVASWFKWPGFGSFSSSDKSGSSNRSILASDWPRWVKISSSSSPISPIPLSNARFDEA